MAHEVEVKILAVDVEAVTKTLADVGAEKILETRFSVDWFQEKGTRENHEPWFLRVRTTSQGQAEVTWKGKVALLGTARAQQEFNIKIDNSVKMTSLFLGIGLEHYAHQEKDRISWRYEDWQFDLDTYPGVPPYLEIEGKDEAHIQEAVKFLRLEDCESTTEGERRLIQEVYRLNWHQMSFAAAPGRSKTPAVLRKQPSPRA